MVLPRSCLKGTVARERLYNWGPGWDGLGPKHWPHLGFAFSLTADQLNPSISMANLFGGFGWIWQGLLPMVNLEFHFFYFLRKTFLSSYLSLTFQGFCRINKKKLFFNGFSYFFYFHFAFVLLNSNLLKFLKYLCPFLSYAKNIFIYFVKIILNLTWA